MAQGQELRTSHFIFEASTLADESTKHIDIMSWSKTKITYSNTLTYNEDMWSSDRHQSEFISVLWNLDFRELQWRKIYLRTGSQG